MNTPDAAVAKRRVSIHRIAMVSSALLLSACSSAPPTLNYTVAIDPTFTADQMDGIALGIDNWRSKLPELQVESSIARCGAPSAHYVCIQPAHDPPNPSDEVIGVTNPGMSGNATVLIYVERIQVVATDVRRLIEQTTAHELGHAMGLRHSSAGALMAPTVSDQAESVTDADVAQFWAVRGR